MDRRRTIIGIGPFCRNVSLDEHANEVLRKTIHGRFSLTKDAVLLLTRHILKQNQRVVLHKVRWSKDIGGYQYLNASTDIDFWKQGVMT